ncbi:MAG: hypothetical protein N2D54_06665 [Chloroflexota bacterium]
MGEYSRASANELETIMSLYAATSSVVVEIEGCDPSPPNYWCEEIPTVNFVYYATQNSRKVLRVQGKTGSKTFSCEGESCRIELKRTSFQGSRVVFWAALKGGVTTERYELKYRVLDSTQINITQKSGWRVDFVSIRLLNSLAPEYYHVWNLLPPVEEIPSWLATPKTIKRLNT